MGKQLNIGLVCIATLKYKIFIPQLLEGVKKYFMPDHKVTMFLFDDEYADYEGDERVRVQQHPIQSYSFPYASLYRYKIFSAHQYQLSKMDYIYYSDIDMRFENIVSDEILCDGLTVVYHPGYYSKKEIVGHWGSNGVARESLAWIEPEKRFGYVAGGFNGARTKEFLEMSKILSERITDDEQRGVMAEYHDESFLNTYLKNYNGNVLYLTPEYCMVEQNNLRELWGISELTPRLIALAKDHNQIRN